MGIPTTTAVRHLGLALVLLLTLVVPLAPPAAAVPEAGPDADDGRVVDPEALAACVEGAVTALAPAVAPDAAAPACERALEAGGDPAWVHAVRELRATGADPEAARAALAGGDEAQDRPERPASIEEARGRRGVREATARQRGDVEDATLQAPDRLPPTPKQQAEAARAARADEPRGAAAGGSDDLLAAPLVLAVSTGSISGQVTEQGSGTPLVDICVTAWTPDFTGYQSTYTDAGGAYALTDLPDGDYTVEFADCFNGTYLTEYWQEAEAEAAATPVVVSGGAAVGDISGTLTLPGSISGTVVSDIGSAPLENVCVYVSDESVGSYGDAVSDANGGYTVTGLATGFYQVYFEPCWDSGLQVVSEYYDDATWEDFTPVPVTAGSETVEINAGLAPGASISGTVTDEASGDPLADMCVQAYDERDSWGSVTTASDGTYTITGLRATGHRVDFSDCDSAEPNHLFEYYDGVRDYDQASLVQAVAGDTVTGIDASLQVPGSISGTVTDDDTGTGLAGICVDAVDQQDWWYGTETDVDGAWTITDVPPGSYQVTFHDCYGGAYASEWYDDTARSAASWVVVASGATTSGIDAGMSTGGGISGTVTDQAGGAALEGICVDAFTEGFESWGGTETGPDGSYEILGLSPGPHYVEFYDCYGSGYANEFYDDAGYTTATLVTVAGSATTLGIDAAMGPGRSISGTVTAADTSLPLEDVCVDVAQLDAQGSGSGYGWGWTSADGTYTVSGLGPGEYTVEFFDCAWEDRGYIGEFYDDVALIEDATPVSVTSSADVAGIDAVLQLGASIQGTVTDADSGLPVEGICVWADNDQVYARTGYTASDGTYTVPGLPTGSYTVEFWDCNDGGYIGEYFDDAADWDTATPVPVTAPEVTGGIDAALLLGGSISGTVTATTGGGPVSDICVDAYDAVTYDWVSSTETGDDGTYSIGGLPGGDHVVEFYDCGAGGLVTEYFDDAPDIGSAMPVTVDRPSDTPGIDAVLAGGGTIAGTVTADDGGAALAGVCVEAEGLWGGWRRTRTAADGSYLLVGLPEDEYTVSFRDCADGGYLSEWWNDAASYDMATWVVVGVEQDVVGIDASLATAGTMSGTVTNTAGSPLQGICIDVYSETDWFEGYTETGSDGTWTVGGLTPGDYTVSFTDCSGSGYASEWYDDKTSYLDADLVPVGVSEDVVGIDAVLGTGGGGGGGNTISGTVTDEDGGAVLSDICVDAIQVDGFGFREATTGGDGTYLLSGMVDGTWAVWFSNCEDARGYVSEYWQDARDFEDATLLVLDGTPITGIDAALALGGSISGVVTDASSGDPLGDVCMYAGPADAQYSYLYFGMSDSDGSYRVGGVEETGPQHMVVFDCAEPGRPYLEQWWDGAADRVDATPIAVTFGQETQGVDVELVLGGWVEGIVTAEDSGAPLADICVEVSGGGQYAFGYTAGDGSYRTYGLPAGSYTVYFYGCGAGNTWAPEYHDNVHAVGSATPVGVTLGSGTTVDAGLVPYSTGDGSISGVVEDSTGAKVQNAFVTTCAPDGRCLSAMTDGAGAYTLSGLVDGLYTVRAAPPGTSLRSASTTVAITGENAAVAPVIVLPAMVPPPSGTSVGGTTGTVPTVFYNTPFDMTTTEPLCEPGDVTYTITGPNGETKTGTLEEGPPGTWSGDIIVPFTGTSTVVLSQPDCDETIQFNLYIDPSGTVKTPEGEPIEGATVTLYRSDTGADATFTVVEDGSAVMAPTNRTNPDTSDADGKWGWDVEPGYYYVTVEKAGCVDPGDTSSTVVSTPVYEIPPAVTDVDLRLDCDGGGATGGLEFVPVAPCAVFDSRSTQATGAFKGAFTKGTTVTYKVTGTVPAGQGGEACAAPPADAVAVELNLVALDSTGSGNLQIAPTGTVPQGGVVNFAPGVNNSNALSVEVDSSGRVDVNVNGGPVKLRGVVLGYYTDVDASGLEFVPVAPCAVFDSRSTQATGAFKGAFTKGTTVTYQVTGTIPAGQGGATCDAPPADAVGVQLNLIALEATGGGNLQIAPSGVVPNGGVVNFGSGFDNSNALSVEVDPDGEVDVNVNGGPVKLRGVVLGYYTDVDASGLEFVPIAPCAVFDSRTGSGDLAGPFPKDTTVSYRVTGTVPGTQGGEGCTAPPDDASAIHINLVALSPQGGGNLQIAPAGTPANGGVVNFAKGGNNSNALDVEIADNAIDVTVKGGPVHVRGVALGYRVPGV